MALTASDKLMDQDQPMTFLRKLLADNSGIATIEYGVIALLLGTGLIASMQSLGNEVVSSFESLENHAASANNPAA